MFAKERLEAIARKVNKEQRVLVKDLATEFNVSEDMIRKDLTVLQKQGRLQKVYGGAVSVRTNPGRFASQQRMRTDDPERSQLAETAFGLIKDGMRLFLDVSVTNIQVARMIAQSERNVTVVTNMIAILNELAEAEHVRLIFIGGTINMERDAFWNASAAELAGHYHYDLSLLGTVGVNLGENSLTTYHEDDGILKRTVLRHSKEAWVIAETHKFQEEGDYCYSSLSDVSGLIVSTETKKTYRTALKSITVRTGRRSHE